MCMQLRWQNLKLGQINKFSSKTISNHRIAANCSTYKKSHYMFYSKTKSSRRLAAYHENQRESQAETKSPPQGFEIKSPPRHTLQRTPEHKDSKTKHQEDKTTRQHHNTTRQQQTADVMRRSATTRQEQTTGRQELSRTEPSRAELSRA